MDYDSMVQQLCIAENEITDIKAQNKKLGDVVLEMGATLETYNHITGMAAQCLKIHAVLIKQLKQERQNEKNLE